MRGKKEEQKEESKL